MRKIRYQSSSRENTVLTIARKSQKDPKLAKATRTNPKLTKKPKKIAKRPKTTKNFKIGEI